MTLGVYSKRSPNSLKSSGFEVSVRDRLWHAIDRASGILNMLALALFYWIHFAQRRLACVRSRRGNLAVPLREPTRKLLYVAFFDDNNLRVWAFRDHYLPGLTEWLGSERLGGLGPADHRLPVLVGQPVSMGQE